MTRTIGEILECDRCGLRRVYASSDVNRNQLQREGWIKVSLDKIPRLRHMTVGVSAGARMSGESSCHLCPDCAGALSAWLNKDADPSAPPVRDEVDSYSESGSDKPDPSDFSDGEVRDVVD